LISLGVPPLGATITLHRVARVYQRQLGFFVSIVIHLTFDDYDMTVMMICSRDDNSPSFGWLLWRFDYYFLLAF